MPIELETSGGRSIRGAPLRARAWHRALLVLTFVACKLLAAIPAHAAGPDAERTPSGAAKLRLAQRGWGHTDPAELQLVLEAVVADMATSFPDRQLGAIEVVPGARNPIVLFDKGPDGAYVVQLSARDSRWYQFVYQFSHELCHIYSNYDNKPSVGGVVVNGNQWFEESLCETAALFTLRRLAARWEAAPPTARWAPQAALFRRYAELLLGEPHRRLPPSYSFVAWFRDNLGALQGTPYLRDKDEVVSNLLLPLFERNPARWGAIAYLNANREDAAKGFGDYLAAWARACPERFRGVVTEIIALFGAAAAGGAPGGGQTS